jgi:hypothetical protein
VALNCVIASRPGVHTVTSENPNAPRKHDDQSIKEKNASHGKNPGTGSTMGSDSTAPAPDNAETTCQCHYQAPHWGWRILEGAALLAAIAYAIITYCMWRDSHRNFVVDQRAWLAIETSFPAPIKEGMALEGDVAVRNTGKTAAKKSGSVWTVDILRNTDSTKFDYSHYTSEAIGILSPNAYTIFPVLNMQDQYTPKHLTKEQADDLNNGRSYLVVYGKGTYRDIFGELHWFSSCAWRSFYAGSGVYMAENCTAYNDTGDGELPK